MENLEKVSHFMRVMGQDMPAKPTKEVVTNPEMNSLRFGLIDEENKELIDAAVIGDIVEVADALCDLQYVVDGAKRAYGFSPELFQKLFDEVHRSNMSKTCKTLQEAEDTVDHYRLNGVAVYHKQVGNLWVVARISDKKVLKSVNYSEPDLRTILREAGVEC